MIDILLESIEDIYRCTIDIRDVENTDEKLNQFYCSVDCLYSNSNRLRKAEIFLKAKLCRRLFLYLSLKYLRKDFHYLN